MEEYKEENNNKKRARDDSDDSVGVYSPELKVSRVDSDGDDHSPASDVNASNTDDSGVSSPDAKRIQDDLLDIFEDADPDSAIQGLDSVIRSFEEEILMPDPAPAVVVTSDSGESRPDLGYLLEASDDELGLPPSFLSGEEQKMETVNLDTSGSGSGPATLEDIGLGFDDGMLYFEPYKFGTGIESEKTVGNDFITLGGGLFESYEAGDVSEFLWRPESLSAS